MLVSAPLMVEELLPFNSIWDFAALSASFRLCKNPISDSLYLAANLPSLEDHIQTVDE